MTRVSVILPIYNAEAFLALSLASLMQQTQRDIRIIAIDDGSTDGSCGILHAAAALDDRITPVFRENRGLIATLNQGLALAETDLVARMDADDIAFPDRFAAQLAVFEDNSRLGLLGTNFVTHFSDSWVEPALEPTLIGPGERSVMGRFCTPLRHPTVMFRRSRLGGADLRYDPGYPQAEDFELFRRLGLTTGIAQTGAAHLVYRIHPGSVSATRMDQMCATHLRILEENLALHYPSAAGTGVVRIAATLDADSVDAAADLIRRLDNLAPQQPENERCAFEIGVGNTFLFLFALMCRARAYTLAHRFVEGARRWHSVRRRERAVLRTPAAHAGMIASQMQVDFRRRLSSRHLSEMLPGHAGIIRRAGLIVRAAGQDRTRDAA